MKKGTFLKKILASVCSASMIITSFAVPSFAAQTANYNIAGVIWNAQPNRLSYWVTSDSDTSNFRISSTSNDTSALIDYSFDADYTLYGRNLDGKPLYFNMMTELLDENNNVIDQKVIRNQYYTLGDVNCDGVVDADDFYAFERFYNSKFNDPNHMPLYYMEVILGMFDYDHDGTIDYDDYIMLLSYVEDYNWEIPTEFENKKFWTTIDPELGEIIGIKDLGKMDLFIGNDTSGNISFGLFGN